MKKLTQDNIATLANLNRRDFLKISGNAAGIVGGALLTNLSMAAPLNSINIDSGKVANVWVNNQGANNWNKYYDKFLRLLQTPDSTLDTQWIKPDQQYLLKITMSDKLGYPYSTDPKLVYSMVRYLVNEKSIPVNNIVISDQLLSKKSTGLSQQLAQLRSSGIYSGIRRALPLKKALSLNAKNKMPLKWLSPDSDFDHIIELTSLTSSHNEQRINEVNNLLYHNTIPLHIRPKMVISSATKVGNKRKIINLQPGMILASNSPLSHELLANAYLSFCATQTVMSTDKGYTVVDNNRRLTHITQLHKAMKQQGHLSEIDWYIDQQDAPKGIVDKISSEYFPAVKVKQYSLA